MSPTATLATFSLTVTFILLLLPLSQSHQSPQNNQLTAYDILQTYDFPVGLLPKGVTGYELNEATGEFEVYLEKTCKFHIESYELEYKSTITGIISKDKLTNLKGVSVKVLLLWFSIVEVVKDDDDIQFSVGIASAKFPIEGFEESPSCGCGFDCVGNPNLEQMKKINRFVSSS